ncbi:hypothetical protein G6F50_017830 [Rhizopus delemar]|uniref:Uncharacterized protein n=1 Tax=Rhizopus delemar TaxID=936053 RepID=A0A9P6XPJ2_9FUNG|nr:hypothetical protein G6F50_017830 [Rhizopus delemar]
MGTFTGASSAESGVTLARFIANIRPELDIYLLTDRQVEQLAGDPAASVIRRVGQGPPDDTPFRQSQALRRAADQHLSCAADCSR